MGLDYGLKVIIKSQISITLLEELHNSLMPNTPITFMNLK